MTKGDARPIIWWVRRDLRLGDNPALMAAVEKGVPVVPVFILDEVFETYGAAPKWRLGLGLDAFGKALADKGSRLILRRGKALSVLRELIADTGASAVHWSRLCDPSARARDEAVKSALRDDGTDARSFPGHLLFEPWTVQTGAGGYYKVFTPYWKSVRSRDPGQPLRTPGKIPVPMDWPVSDILADWRLGDAMRRGASVVGDHVLVGESGAASRLGAFIANSVGDYASQRDIPGVPGTSRLSENLTYGEISVRSVWHAGIRAREDGKPGAETFLKELAWRDFAYHLAFHTPRLISGNWNTDWDGFPWREDADGPEVLRWQQGRTGVPFVDAAQRELYVTGTMHNRSRMITASFLTKHLRCHWRIGLKWFEDCLIDWDPASNALGWQWVAGSGPDAAPYFRVFNPETQRQKFDPDCEYIRRWIAEGQDHPGNDALSFFKAAPVSWSLSASDGYPDQLVDLAEGRNRALAAYEGWKA